MYGNNSSIYGTGKTYSKLITLFEDSLKLLEENGVKVIHIKNFYKREYANVEENTLGGWTMCHTFNQYIKNTSSKIKSYEQLAKNPNHIYELNVNNCKRDLKEIDKYETRKKDYRNYVDNIYKEYNLDALVYPTTKNRLSLVGESNFESPSYAIAPVLGLPAVSMPLGFIDDLPYGIEFVSTKNNEKKLYEILYNYEQINKVYKLPKEAKNLYEIPESVEQLKKLYEEDIDINKEAYLTIKEFFKNYSNYGNIEEIDRLAKELYINYEASIINSENDNKAIIAKTIIVIILLIIFLIFLQIVENKKLKRRRRHH